MEEMTHTKPLLELNDALKSKCKGYLIHRKLSEKTKELYGSVLDSIFKNNILTQKVFDDYYSKGSRYRATLKVILDTCEHYDIPYFKYKQIKTIKTQAKRPIVMSEEDVIKLSNQIEDYGLLIRCAYYIGGGLRFSSAVLLRWDNFLWQIWVKDKDSVGKCDIFAKGKTEDFLDVDPILMKELHQLSITQGKIFQDIPFKNCKGNPYLFIDDQEKEEIMNEIRKEKFDEMLLLNGEKPPKKDIERLANNRIIKKMHDRVDYKLMKVKDLFNRKVKFHSIRHSKATNLLREGFKLSEIQDMLMHKSISTTQIYVNPTKEEITEKYNLMVKKRKINSQ
jgi:integrase